MKGKEVHYLSAAGESLLRVSYAQARPFYEGLSAVQVVGDCGGEPYEGCWGFINIKGEEVIAPRYPFVGDFSEGLAVVRDSSNRFGYINAKGELVIKPSFYDEANHFSHGLALVKLNGLYGFLGRGGSVKIPVRYFKAQSFTDGLALVSVAVP